MRNILAYIIIAALALSLIAMIPVTVRAEVVGYLAIKDYLGRTWTIQDIQKIINTTVNTPDGLKSLADYFWIVVDEDPENKKYSLKDFIASPLDNTTAVLPLSLGDHYVDIYWFGFHQKQLVNIAENYTYVLNLETAPTLPLKYYGEPPESAEWDITSHPSGVKLQRKDGKAYVQFVYNQSYIEVYWYDENTGDNYFSIDVKIDSSYQWKFHLTDPQQTYYNEEQGVTFFGVSFTVAKEKEEVKWEQIGDVLHVAYLVSVTENVLGSDFIEHMFNAVNEAFQTAYWTFVSPAVAIIHDVKGLVELGQATVDNFLAWYKPEKKTYIIIFDVYVTPTQIVVTAHAYYKDENGNLIPKPITSDNCFTYNNRLVFIKLLDTGYMFTYRDVEGVTKNVPGGSAWSSKATFSNNYSSYGIVDVSNSEKALYVPGGDYVVFALDDMSMYSYEVWFKAHFYAWHETDPCGHDMSVSYKVEVKIRFSFADSAKADAFEQNLVNQGLEYVRDGNAVTITAFTDSFSRTRSSADTLNEDFAEVVSFSHIEKLVPAGSEGNVTIYITAYASTGGQPMSQKSSVTDILFWLIVQPKMVPPKLTLLENGYQHVNNAFMVQIFFDNKEYKGSSYVISYYILDNEPPPHYLIKDVYYDPDADMVHYVYTVIPVDVYGQDVITMTWQFDSSTNVTTWAFQVKPTVRTIREVTFAMVDYSKLAFLNMPPEMLEPMFAPPPYPGYGTPTRDWPKIQFNDFDFNITRGDHLYFFDNSTYKWVEVNVYAINGTQDYEVKRVSDNATVEILEVNTHSDYYYKWNSTSFSYTGWLYNDNGTLVFVVDSAKWSFTSEEISQILKLIDIQGFYDQWVTYWNSVAEQLGLLASAVSSASKGTSVPWTWLLLGLGGGFVLALILLVAIGGRGPTVVLGGRFRYSKVGGAKCRLSA